LTSSKERVKRNLLLEKIDMPIKTRTREIDGVDSTTKKYIKFISYEEIF
jgi:hypothetical protein